jgi:hypothetical protein
MRLSKLSLVIGMVFAVSDPSGAQTLDRCHDASYGVVDPGAGWDPPFFIAVWGQEFWMDDSHVATMDDEVLGELNDPTDSWARTSDTLVWAYTGPDITVEFEADIDLNWAIEVGDVPELYVELNTAFQSEGAVDVGDHRTPAIALFSWPTSGSGYYGDKVRNVSGSVLDMIALDSGDSIGIIRRLIEPADETTVNFDLDVHNAVFRIRQVSPPCYR